MEQVKGKWALITGASSGIGKEFAKELAKAGANVIITARRAERLETLKKELRGLNNIAVEVISNDLSQAEGAAQLYQAVQALKHPVALLINNAGVGEIGRFLEMSLEKQMAMLQLNVNAVTELTYRFGQQMSQRGEGWILQLSSIMAYAAYPNYAIYAATKAYVVNFAEALHTELKEKGVVVSVLCPGPTKTEFMSRTSMDMGKAAESFMMSPEKVARQGLKGLLAGKTIMFPGSMTPVMAYSSKLMPKSLLMKAIDQGLKS